MRPWLCVRGRAAAHDVSLIGTKGHVLESRNGLPSNGVGSERDEAARTAHEARRSEPAPALETALPVGPGAPLARTDVLRLQRASGNAAVHGLLQRQAVTPTHATPVNLRMDSHGSAIPSD